MSAPDVLLTYSGTPLNDDAPGEGIYFEIRGGLFTGLTTKGTDGNPPNSDGVFARPRRLLRRTIPLLGWISGNAAATYYDNWAIVAALFDLKGHADFVATLPNGDIYTLDCRPINLIPNEVFSDGLALPSVELHSYEGADWDITPAGS